MITIYWHCLGMASADERFVAGALEELAQHLKEDPKEDPIKLCISIKRLRDEPDLTKEVNAILHKLTNPSYTFNRCVNETFALFDRLSVFDKTCPSQLLVYCRPDSSIANAARRENPFALWGAATGVGGSLPDGCKSRVDSEYLRFMRENFLCAVYKPNDKNGVFHETLHLLGVDDCYYIENDTVQKKSDCNLDGCIMEYAPPKNTWENWPFLCDKNVKKLKDIAKKA